MRKFYFLTIFLSLLLGVGIVFNPLAQDDSDYAGPDGAPPDWDFDPVYDEGWDNYSQTGDIEGYQYNSDVVQYDLNKRWIDCQMNESCAMLKGCPTVFIGEPVRPYDCMEDRIKCYYTCEHTKGSCDAYEQEHYDSDNDGVKDSYRDTSTCKTWNYKYRRVGHYRSASFPVCCEYPVYDGSTYDEWDSENINVLPVKIDYGSTSASCPGGPYCDTASGGTTKAQYCCANCCADCGSVQGLNFNAATGVVTDAGHYSCDVSDDRGVYESGLTRTHHNVHIVNTIPAECNSNCRTLVLGGGIECSNQYPYFRFKCPAAKGAAHAGGSVPPEDPVVEDPASLSKSQLYDTTHSWYYWKYMCDVTDDTTPEGWSGEGTGQTCNIVYGVNSGSILEDTKSSDTRCFDPNWGTY